MGHDGAEDIDIAKHDSTAERVSVTVTPSTATVNGLTATFSTPVSSVEGITLAVSPASATATEAGTQSTQVAYSVISVADYNTAHPDATISVADVDLNPAGGTITWEAAAG